MKFGIKMIEQWSFIFKRELSTPKFHVKWCTWKYCSSFENHWSVEAFLVCYKGHCRKHAANARSDNLWRGKLVKMSSFSRQETYGTRFDENGIREKYYICLQIAVNIGCIMCVFVESQGIETEFYET